MAASIVILLAIFTLVLGTVGDGRASDNEGSQIFMPVVNSNPRLAPVPKLIASVSLGDDAECPYHMAYNQYSGLLYITNEDSRNVSIIRDKEFAGNIATGNWPKFVVSDPNSDRVTISHVWDGIRIMQGTNITADIPKYVEINNRFEPNPQHRKIYDDMFQEYLNIYKQNKTIYKRLNSKG